MSRPRFLADHDLNEHIVTGLLRREPAVECARVREFEMGEALDDVILDYAAQHGWLVVSHDVNTMPAAAFARLANRRAMAGLLMVRQTEPIRVVTEVAAFRVAADVRGRRAAGVASPGGSRKTTELSKINPSGNAPPGRS